MWEDVVSSRNEDERLTIKEDFIIMANKDLLISNEASTDEQI